MKAVACGMAVAAALAGPAAAADRPPESSCVSCHRQLDGEAAQVLEDWDQDVHARAGLGCEACHGGDPSASLADDADGAMSPAAGFRGAPGRLEIPAACGTCHADAAFIRRYNPKLRTDQLAEYRTSVHGTRNAQGDPVPATCVDCHGTHGIRPVSAPEAPVYATNVPATCGRCHADAEKMRPYGIPTDQLAAYSHSVHGIALLVDKDTGAPACNDCHGNHGAVPPGVSSVANVCGQCHAQEAELFRASFKKELFDRLEVPECSVCHGEHDIGHPTPEWFRTGSGPRLDGGSVTRTDPFEGRVTGFPEGGTARATWSVSLLPRLDSDDPGLEHFVDVETQDGATLRLDATVRPGVGAQQRRVSGHGLDATLAVEPLSGAPLRAGDAVRLRLDLRPAGAGAAGGVVIRDRPGAAIRPIAGSICMTCHVEGDQCDVATAKMYEAIIAAEHALRRADRGLARAERAGMPVQRAKFDLRNDGHSAAVQATALLHSFDAERVVARANDARQAALVASGVADDAMDELHFRHVGLGLSLVLVVFALIVLGLKIRQVDRGLR